MTLPIVVNSALFIDLRSESLDEANVGIDTRLVVFIHPALIFVESSEVLLQVHQLVLKQLVVSLSLSEAGSFLHQLCDHSFLLSRSPSTAATSAVSVGVAYDSLSLIRGCFMMLHYLLRVRVAFHLGHVELLVRGLVLPASFG